MKRRSGTSCKSRGRKRTSYPPAKGKAAEGTGTPDSERVLLDGSLSEYWEEVKREEVHHAGP